MNGQQEKEQRTGQDAQVLSAQEVTALRDARRKVKGAFAELSLALATIDKLLKTHNTTTV